MNRLPRCVIEAPDGARAEIHLHGAHVTSWVPAGETADRMFVSAASHFAPDAPIRGGVPICFPQFADQGPLPMHGFVRTLDWQRKAAGALRSGAADVFIWDWGIVRAHIKSGKSPFFLGVRAFCCGCIGIIVIIHTPIGFDKITE